MRLRGNSVEEGDQLAEVACSLSAPVELSQSRSIASSCAGSVESAAGCDFVPVRCAGGGQEAKAPRAGA